MNVSTEWNYNRCLIESSLEAFVVIDRNGIIKDVNHAAVLTTGISKDLLIDTEFTNYFTEPQNAEIAYKQAFNKGYLCDFKLRVKHVDGNSTPVLLNASIVRDSKNDVLGVCVTLRDNTSTQKIEDELIHLKNNLEQHIKQRAIELIASNKELAFQNDEKFQRASELVIANKQTNRLKEQNIVLKFQKKRTDEASHLKSSFLSNMSHELRTPLNAIVGFTDLALKTNLSTKQRNYLSKIKTSSYTLLGLISDILDLSKIEAGKLELEMVTFDLEEVIQNAVNQVSTKSQEKGLVLVYSIDEDVPVSLRGDSLRLGQVLINLVSNAVKFTDRGKVEIQVKLLEKNSSNVLIQFSVMDTGIGMTKIQMMKLFQPFSQADTSTTRKYGGTGLGLSISQELIHKMHGEIWVNSTPGEGSSFFFTIKIDVADELRYKNFKNKFEKWHIRVLVVDSQNESRALIGNMLSEMSLEVALCSTGKEALAILEDSIENNAYDLVIMDWKMNEMDGIQTAKRIKQLFAFKKAPEIILMTSYLNQGVQEKAEQIGLRQGVLYKPITPSLLFNSIIQVCYKEDFEQSSERTEHNYATDHVPHLWKTKVLLVEDNEINREVAQEILQEAGLDVTLANNGLEAVNLVNTKVFDVVLMDIQMPIMDGYVATREIRKNPQFADLPIIAMTANALLSDQIECYNAGMNDHIAKPINTLQLFNTIALWIKKDSEDLEESILRSDASDLISLADSNDLRLKSPGIDIQAGLNRLGGNQSLYLTLLNKFQINHKQTVEEIRYALTHKDQKTAARLVHSLKGAAGNLSIRDVFLDSSTLESAFKINRLDFIELLLEKLEESLEQSFVTILALEKSFLGAQDATEVKGDAFKLQSSLIKLENLIYDCDLEALECIADIVSHTKDYNFFDKAEELKKSIDHYDFDRAIIIFNEINQLIRKERTHGKEQ
jgi:PAS domain S-box-containing protein